MPRYDVFERYVLDVRWVDGRWVAFRVGEGTRRSVGLHIPASLDESGLGRYLEDVLHESGRPGAEVRRLP